MSLYSWCEMVVVDAQTRAFFDETLYENCPDLLAQSQVYEDEVWKLPVDLPNFATKALRSSKARIQRERGQYLRLAEDERPNESWLISYHDAMQGYGESWPR